MAKNQKPAASVTVEGGYGLEGKAHVGPVEVKGGAAVKGEVELSTQGTTKVSAKAEVGGNIGPVKLPGAQAEVVTKNEEGKSEAPTISHTDPGISHGNSEATSWKDQITLGVSLYVGWGAGISVTVRYQPIIDFLEAPGGCGCDFNTNQHGMGAFQ